MTVIERSPEAKRAFLDGYRAGVRACYDHGRRDAEAMAESIEATLPAADRGAVEALREIANNTRHDGRWAAGRAESALVTIGVDPRLPQGGQ